MNASRLNGRPINFPAFVTEYRMLPTCELLTFVKIPDTTPRRGECTHFFFSTAHNFGIHMHFINDESLSDTAHKPQQQSSNRQTRNKFFRPQRIYRLWYCQFCLLQDLICIDFFEAVHFFQRFTNRILPMVELETDERFYEPNFFSATLDTRFVKLLNEP